MLLVKRADISADSGVTLVTDTERDMGWSGAISVKKVQARTLGCEVVLLQSTVLQLTCLVG
jgi:hypothetical protein